MIGNVELLEPELPMRQQPAQARTLQLDILIGVEIVDPDNRMTRLKKRERDAVAYEPGRAGNEKLHGDGCLSGLSITVRSNGGKGRCAAAGQTTAAAIWNSAHQTAKQKTTSAEITCIWLNGKSVRENSA